MLDERDQGLKTIDKTIRDVSKDRKSTNSINIAVRHDRHFRHDSYVSIIFSSVAGY